MKIPKTTFAALMALLLPVPVAAHEGHGFIGTVESLLHWLSSPYHLTIVAAIALVAVAIPLGIRRLSQRRPTDVERWG